MGIQNENDEDKTGNSKAKSVEKVILKAFGIKLGFLMYKHR